MSRKIVLILVRVLHFLSTKWLVLLVVSLGGLILVFFDQIPVMAFSGIAHRKFSEKISHEEAFYEEGVVLMQDLLAQPYPPPATQPGVQPTLPYPAPVDPTRAVSTPTYPPPDILPTATQSPVESTEDGTIRTPTLIPLPLETLTWELPTCSVIIGTDAPDVTQDVPQETEKSEAGPRQTLLVLVGLLWVMLGGWVYLIARSW
jgi:hypothetical protein